MCLITIQNKILEIEAALRMYKVIKDKKVGGIIQTILQKEKSQEGNKMNKENTKTN